jgi:hypothetical protein
MRADSFGHSWLAGGVLCIAAALIGCMSDVATAAAKATPATGERCTFGAFVQEDDPAGLNVRAAPSAAARILGTLPPSFASADNPGFAVRIELDVLGQREGWFHVVHARDNEQLTGRAVRKVFAGEGWVSGRKLTVKSQATQGRTAPEADAPVALALDGGDSLDGDAIVAATRLVSCRGDWAQIELDLARLPDDVRAQMRVAPGTAGAAAGHPRAWVDRICGVQETSCDGQSGARAAQ